MKNRLIIEISNDVLKNQAEMPGFFLNLKIKIMERIPIVSSHIVSVGYDENAQILEVEFKGHSVYQYFRVPIEVYEKLMNSNSKGSYFVVDIKDKFKFNKVQQ